MAATTDKSLEFWIWDAACSIRGAKDAPNFKDYTVTIRQLIDEGRKYEVAAIAQAARASGCLPARRIRLS